MTAPFPRSLFRVPLVRLLAVVVLAAGLTCATRAQSAPPAAAPSVAPAPKVTALEGDFYIGSVVKIKVEHLEAWAAAPGHDVGKLIPYINGRGLRGCFPVEVHASAGHLHFELNVTPPSRDAWIDVLGPFNTVRRRVEFSVGPENQTPFDSDLKGEKSPVLTIVQQPYGWVSLVIVLGTLVALIVLARNTDMIRDSGPGPGLGKRKPYNLGRAQMAFWFFLTFASYIVIWLITDAIDTITPALLGLMGISATTALSEVLIDASKDATALAGFQSATGEKLALEQTIADVQSQLATLAAKAVPTVDDLAGRDSLNRQLLDQRTRLNQLAVQLKSLAPTVGANESGGFFQDILSDASGYSFHRFQIFAWTIALGIVFVSDVYSSLTMPEFSATMLGLMGMSSGTYIGFKFPEKR